MPKRGPCENCDGMCDVFDHATGEWEPCPECNGEGWIG